MPAQRVAARNRDLPPEERISAYNRTMKTAGSPTRLPNLVPMWLPAYDRTVEHRFDPRYAGQPCQKRDCYNDSP